MGWSSDGRSWVVDESPWLDPLLWTDHLTAASRIRWMQKHPRPDLGAVACPTCGDCEFLSSVGDDGFRYAVFCPTCRPEQHRDQVVGDSFAWSSSVHGGGKKE